MVDAIVIEPSGRSWAVKHNGGFLGYTRSHEDAALVAQDLVEWLLSQGREVDVVDETPGHGSADVAQRPAIDG